MKLIVANWKMYLSIKKSVALARNFRRTLSKPKAEVVICPNLAALSEVRAALQGSAYKLAAPDIGTGERGPGTGEISVHDLKELGCKYVLVGHSERRALGETDAVIRQKFETAAATKLTPILCVGEKLSARKSGQATSVIRHQLTAVLKKIPITQLPNYPITIAYEPIWAIGTGVPAHPRDAVKMHRAIRTLVTKLVPRVKVVRVLYGGSVDPNNAAGFLSEKEVDGLLVGGASTKPSFIEIIKATSH